MAEEKLEETLFIRMTKADKEQLQRIAERVPMKDSQLARIALRIGLAELERDPSRIFGTAKPKRRSSK